MKKAFTMIELVFVIVIIGILAAVIIPNTRTNPAAEAATQLQSHIRYTQHLAMINDKFDSTDSTWMRNRWQIVFNGNQYSIVSDDNTVFAKDLLTQNDLDSIDLDDEYTVSVALSAGCAGQTDITFDHLGRPMVGDISDDTHSYETGQLLILNCIITLSPSNGDDVNLTITPETGYVSGI